MFPRGYSKLSDDRIAELDILGKIVSVSSKVKYPKYARYLTSKARVRKIYSMHTLQKSMNVRYSIENENNVNNNEFDEGKSLSNSKICLRVGQVIELENESDLSTKLKGISYHTNEEAAFWYELKINDINAHFISSILGYDGRIIKFTGKHLIYYDDGQLKQICHIRDSKLSGELITWYPNGQIFSEENCYKNKASGYFKLFYQNGQLKEKFFCINGQLHGLHEEWYKNGNIKSKTYYNEDKRCDIEMSWYPDGKPCEKVELDKDGKVCGEQIKWYSNGNMSMRRFFISGKLDGPCQYWYRDGTPKTVEFYISSIICDTNTHVYETNYLQNMKHGPYEEFYENGQHKIICNYIYGKLQNNYQEYHEDGQIKCSRYYNYGELQKSFEWDERGHLLPTIIDCLI